MSMSIDITKSDQHPDADRLAGLAGEVLRLAAARGASQAEVSISEDSGLAVNVRMGEVETVERTRDRGVAVTVYFGQSKASASTADLQPASLIATVEQACAIAKFTESDPAAGLAEAPRLREESTTDTVSGSARLAWNRTTRRENNSVEVCAHLVCP